MSGIDPTSLLVVRYAEQLTNDADIQSSLLHLIGKLRLFYI